MSIVATEARLEVENALGTPIAITALTKASPGVATATSHGLSNGDVVKLAVSSGMIELDGQVCRVANVDTNTFELEGIDTTSYSTWESGTATEVTSWFTVSSATDVDLGNASATELDGSKLIHKKTVTLYGRPGSVSGTVAIHHEPANSAIAKIKAASVSDLLAFRLTWNDGSLCYFGGKTAYSGGFSANQNGIVTGSIPMTVPAEIAEYAS